GVGKPVNGSRLVREHSLAPPGGSASVSSGGARLVGCDARWTCPRVLLTRYAGGLHAARRWQQGHVGTFQRARRYFFSAAAARSAGRSESRGDDRSSQPRSRSHVLAGPLRRTLRAFGARTSLHSGPNHGRVWRTGKRGVGVSDEASRLFGNSRPRARGGRRTRASRSIARI